MTASISKAGQPLSKAFINRQDCLYCTFPTGYNSKNITPTPTQSHTCTHTENGDLPVVSMNRTHLSIKSGIGLSGETTFTSGTPK